ncbi:hypothetical protein VdG1_07509 [Verticillium dahliae VDG1]|nr:hypothetical protein VdG1_07509 [Verticillium dahliae VDG1]
MAHPPEPPFVAEERAGFDLNLSHGHRDLIRVFNRHKDGVWRLCDTWGAHGGETLELQWLPPTVYPNLLASLGGYGRFKLWAEDPSAAPGRRFSAGSSRTLSGKPAFETRSNKAPYRSFSIKHNEETRHTYLALLAADGSLSVYENDQPENLSEYTLIDDFAVAPKPARGEEPGQVAHVVREVAKLDSHRTPVWRVDFDDDGQILGSTGDDGKLVFYRQTPQGAWAKSSELGMLKTRMATPS